MADTIIEAVYTTIKKNSIINTIGDLYYPYVTDKNAKKNYAFMFEVSDPRNRESLCDSEGGECRVQFTYVSENKIDCVNTIETLITYIRTLVGNYINVKIDNIVISNVRDVMGLDVQRPQIYSRIFDAIFTWRKI